MLSIHTLQKQRGWCWGAVQWHNIHKKSHVNWSNVSAAQMEEHTCHSGPLAHFFLV